MKKYRISQHMEITVSEAARAHPDYNSALDSLISDAQDDIMEQWEQSADAHVPYVLESKFEGFMNVGGITVNIVATVLEQ